MLGNFIRSRLLKFSCFFFNWLKKRANCDSNGAKTGSFAEKLQKFLMFGFTGRTAVRSSALLNPFDFATALAKYFTTLVLQPIERPS